MLITLSDLQAHRTLIPHPQLQLSSVEQFNRQLEIAVQQLRLQLPLNLEDNPQLRQAIVQLQILFPDLFDSQKLVRFNHQLRVPLAFTNEVYWLEIPVHFLVRNYCPALLGLGMRSLDLQWRDRIQLWALTESYQYLPEQVEFWGAVFHQPDQAEMIQQCWNQDTHWLTQLEIVQTLTGALPPKPSLVQSTNFLDISTIDEVPL